MNCSRLDRARRGPTRRTSRFCRPTAWFTAGYGRIGCGVLRSRTFTITHPQILYRVAGKNARIRLILDGYQMMDFSGLLFSGTTFEVNTDGQWIWHRQAGDLQNHIGRRAYIELIDDGDGWLACDEIRFSNGGPEPVAIPHRNHAVVLADESVTSLESLANRLAPFVTFSKSVPALARGVRSELEASERIRSGPDACDRHRRRQCRG